MAWRVAVSEKSVGSGLGGGDIALVGGGFSLGLGLDMDAFSLSLSSTIQEQPSDQGSFISNDKLFLRLILPLLMVLA